ncbi:MAG: DUF2148 domain-containing protein, partial [Bacillota bacterium]
QRMKIFLQTEKIILASINSIHIIISEIKKLTRKCHSPASMMAVAALRAGMIKGEVAIGVPVSATGKNIYFDR